MELKNMNNIKTIENEKKNIIKKFKPEEMEAYIKSLVAVLFESYLAQDFEKCSSAKQLIEEATDIFLAEGYSNALTKELEFRLEKAIEVLVEVLNDRDMQKIELSKVIVANSYDSKIKKVIHNNSILKSLIASYEKRPSEELALAVKDVLFIVESDLIGVKFLLEEKEITENSYFSEDVEILKEYYSQFLDLQKKINSF